MSTLQGPDKLPVTVLLACKNEEANIRRCLEALRPAERVILLDSQSTDGTLEIGRSLGAEVVQFHYRGGYPKKRQWALENLDLRSEWICFVDADEVMTEPLWAEIAGEIRSPKARAGYFITKHIHFLGKALRFGGFSFADITFFRRGKGRFERLLEDDPEALDMEVHERLIVDGSVGKFREPLLHDDFKGLERFIRKHNYYSTWEARLRYTFLKTGRWGEETIRPRLLGSRQEIRRFLKSLIVYLPFEPTLWFVYHYFLRLGILEGRRGWIASRLRAQHFANVRAKLFELRLRDRHPTRGLAGPRADPSRARSAAE
jgi:glycosyltransferase involved in cell wall biosynthesis